MPGFENKSDIPLLFSKHPGVFNADIPQQLIFVILCVTPRV